MLTVIQRAVLKMSKFNFQYLFLLIFVGIASSQEIQWSSTSQTRWTNRKVYEFENIEYGVFAADERKFLPSFKRKLTKNSTENDLDSSGVEKPLHLTIYTKNLSTRQPVMVYIPGFDLISPNVEQVKPGYLLEKDIVLINVQYRMGPLGFLSLRNPRIPGNAAVFDIILALKWIQRNIEKFGGDRNRVTLFGQYKAAGLIHVLALSDLGRNLFQQAIYQSGSALLKNFTTQYPLKYAREVGRLLGCPSVQGKLKLASCLMEVDGTALEVAFTEIWKKHKGNIPFITIGGPSHVLSKTPEEIHRSGQFETYPKIVGFVDQPSAYFLDYFDPTSASFFTLDRFSEDALTMVDTSTIAFGNTPLERLFPNASALANLQTASVEVLQKAFSLLVTSVLDWSNYYFKSAIYYFGFVNKTPKTYAYSFKYSGEYHSLPRKKDNLLNEVTILDDNLYLFDRDDLELNQDDTRIAKLMVELWTSFAESGTPKASKVIDWPAVRPGADEYLLIDEDILVAQNYIIEFESAVHSFLQKSDEHLINRYDVL